METKNINVNIPEDIFKSSDEIQFWDTVSITRQGELLCNTTSYTVKNPYKYKLKSRDREVDFEENNLFLPYDQKVYSKPKITRGPLATSLT